MAVNTLRYRLSLWLVPLLYSLMTRLLFSTYRVRAGGKGAEVIDMRLAEKAPFVAAFWHYGVIFFPYLTRGRKWVAMVSASKDGEYIARILERIGFKTVRGSSHHRRVSALRRMLQWVRSGHNAGIVADGSQGPARKAQSGPILLAAKTGCPIMPMAWSADSYWTFKSWDRTILPKPFARIFVEFGPPLEVPAGIRGEEVEGYRLRLEKEIDAVYLKAWSHCNRKGH